MADTTRGERGLLDRANDVMERIVSTIEDAFETTREKAAEQVNGVLDRLVRERFEVRDRAHAIQLLEADAGSDTEVARYVRGAVGSRLVGYIARLLVKSRFSRFLKLTPTRLGMTLALGRAQLGVQRVLYDVSVLASYVHRQARAHGVDVSMPTLRATVISVVVDDRKKVDERYAGPRGGLAVVKAMVAEAVSPANATERSQRAERRLDAIGAVDLQALVADIAP